jgi:peptidoglycan/LPS O-acetylase OafA/YrhL
MDKELPNRTKADEVISIVGGRHAYRADVDGLRAIAVLAVVFFHAGFGVPGGFAGVDVFFVISGFLITRILILELASGSFSFVRFWERRARRIFPVLAVVVTACLLVGFFVLLPFGFEVLGQTTFTVMGLASNIFFWLTNDYFSPNSKENPLLHTWSLGVEEQFYLLYPLLLVLLVPLGRKTLLSALAAICVLSIACSIWWVTTDATAAFYLLPSRAWELGLGGLVALNSNRSGLLVRETSAWLGLLLVISSFWLLTKYTPFPGTAALPSVLGTALIIWAGSGLGAHEEKPIVVRLLGWRPLVFIGLISYSLYLWHWPFFAFHRYLTFQSPSVGLSLLYVLAAFLFSVATYYAIEQPIRRKTVLASRKSIFYFWGGTSAVLGAVGLALAFSDGLPGRLSETALLYAQVQGQKTSLINEPAGSRHTRRGVLGAEDGSVKALVWGDSHANAMLPALDVAGKQAGMVIQARIMMGNAPVLGWSYEPPDSVAGKGMLSFNSAVYDEIARTKEESQLDMVFLIFRWARYLQRTPPLEFENPPSGFAEALDATLEKLTALGVKVIVMREPPSFPVHVPRAFALHELIGSPLPKLSITEAASFSKPYTSLIKAITKSSGRVVLLDPTPGLVGDNGLVRTANEEGKLLYADEHHLSYSGALQTAPILIQAIKSTLDAADGTQ